MRHRQRETIHGDLDRDVDADRADRQSSARFGEVAPAVPLVGLRAPDAAQKKRMAAKTPPRRSIADVYAGAHVVRSAVREGVRRGWRRAVEGDPNHRQLLDASADGERWALTRAEGVDRDADPLSAFAEFQYVDQRQPIFSTVVERLQVRLADAAAEQIFERMRSKPHRLRVLPVITDADEVAPRLRRVISRVLRRRRSRQRRHEPCGCDGL